MSSFKNIQKETVEVAFKVINKVKNIVSPFQEDDDKRSFFEYEQGVNSLNDNLELDGISKLSDDDIG